MLLVKQKTAKSDDEIKGHIDEEVNTYVKEMEEAEEELDKIETGLGDVDNLANALQALLKSVEKK